MQCPLLTDLNLPGCKGMRGHCITARPIIGLSSFLSRPVKTTATTAIRVLSCGRMASLLSGLWALLQHGVASLLGSAMRQARWRSACYQLFRGAIAFWIDAGATSAFPPIDSAASGQ
jgi:hypothetical protein